MPDIFGLMVRVLQVAHRVNCIALDVICIARERCITGNLLLSVTVTSELEVGDFLSSANLGDMENVCVKVDCSFVMKALFLVFFIG